jgi:hypothetical protein
VKKIRELITRFEVCHFKYQTHLEKIKDSIKELNSNVDTKRIGANHIQHGEKVLDSDTTGRSLIGQQYVWAIKEWLNENDRNEVSDKFDKILGQQVQSWLGEKNRAKIELVRLLLARLTWDWDSYEKFQHGKEYKDIEYQAARMDICHYAFPKNLDLLLKGIGQMEAVEETLFEGCGSYTPEIKRCLENQFLELNSTLESFQADSGSKNIESIQQWLVACLTKTIKENVNILIPLNGLKY